MTPDGVRGTGGRHGVIYSWLFQETALTSHAKLLFCCLTTYANTDTGRAWPGQERLAEETGLSVATIRRATDELEAAGLLTTERRRRPDGRMGGNVYVLATVRVAPPLPESDGPPLPESGLEHAKVKEQETSMPPSLALVGVPVRDNASDTFPFDAFWEAYPRRNGKRLLKADAVKTWDRLTIREKDAAMASVGNYRQACDDGLTIACDAVRWLRRKSWEEWTEPAVDDRQKPKEESWAQAQSRLIQERGF